MLSIELIGAEEVERSLEETSDSVDNISEGIYEAVEKIILPEVYSRSISVWNVRTGVYSSAWYSYIETARSVVIANNAGYSEPLEFGWTTRGGTRVESEGVLMPTLFDNMDRLTEYVTQWIK